MHDFAKLYRADDIGQVLVVVDDNTVIITCAPPGMGLYNMRSLTPDGPEGRKLALKLFSEFDEDKAFRLVRKLLNDDTFSKLRSGKKGSMDA